MAAAVEAHEREVAVRCECEAAARHECDWRKGEGERQQKGKNARLRRLGIMVINTIGARAQRPGDRKRGDGAPCRECHRAEAPCNPLGA